MFPQPGGRHGMSLEETPRHVNVFFFFLIFPRAYEKHCVAYRMSLLFCSSDNSSLQSYRSRGLVAPELVLWKKPFRPLSERHSTQFLLSCLPHRVPHKVPKRVVAYAEQFLDSGGPGVDKHGHRTPRSPPRHAVPEKILYVSGHPVPNIHVSVDEDLASYP